MSTTQCRAKHCVIPPSAWLPRRGKADYSSSSSLLELVVGSTASRQPSWSKCDRLFLRHFGNYSEFQYYRAATPSDKRVITSCAT